MRYESAKGPAAVKLDGVKIDFESIGTALKAVSFTASNGDHVKIAMDGYTMTCLVQAPPKKEPRYVLHGEVEDIGAIRRVFMYEHEAKAARDEIAGKFRVAPELKVTKTDVEIDDAGQHVDSSIPF